MQPATVPDRGHVIPPYRAQGDPLYPVPVTIPCTQCGKVAALQPYIVGYGYDCFTCGEQTPIICAP